MIRALALVLLPIGFLAAASLAWADPPQGSASPASVEPGIASSAAANQSSSDVSVEWRIPPDRLTAYLTLEFHHKGPPVTEPVFAVAAFDIAAGHSDFRDLSEDRAPSLTAFATDSETRTEVWFGKTIEAGQKTAVLKLQLPEVIQAVPGSGTQYQIMFGVIDETLKRIAQESKAISLAEIHEVHVVLPEGYTMPEDHNWTRSNTDPKQQEFVYTGDLSDGKVIKAQFTEEVSPSKRWLQENIANFAGTFVVILVVIGAIYKIAANSGYKVLVAKLVLSSAAVLGALSLWLDMGTHGAQGWLERDWLMIDFIAASAVSILVPAGIVDTILKAVKDPGANAEGK